MSTNSKINGESFFRRMDALFLEWRKDEGPDGMFKGSATLALLYGKDSEDIAFCKTNAMFRWMLGYDFTDSLVLMDKRGVGKVTFLVSEAKNKLLEAALKVPEGLDLEGRQPVDVELIVRNKGSEAADMDRLVSRLKSGAVGGLWNTNPEQLVHPHEGSFAAAFLGATEAEGIHLVDVSEGFAEILLVKDLKDVNFVKSACSISDVVLKKFVIPRIEDDANEGKKISPSKLSDFIEGYFREPTKISSKLQPLFVDSCYNPIFSSKPRIMANLTEERPSTKPLDYSVIVCGVGAKYKSLCSNVLRTVLINPSDEVSVAYNALMKAHAAAVAAIRPGVAMSEVFKVAKRVLAEHDAALADALDPVVGHSLGYEFYESVTLTEFSHGNFASSQTFNVQLLLQGIAQGKHAMGLADTVLVTADSHQVLTKATKEGLQYDLEDAGSSDDGDDLGIGAKTEEMGKRKSRMRDATALTTEQELKEKQQENFERLQEEMRRRAAHGDDLIGGDDDENRTKDWLQVNAYPRGASSFPSDAAPFRLVVDQENETILMPINGYVVPFHVSLIKSFTKMDDSIRFQFHIPGKGKLSVSANAIQTELPNTVWIKEIVYQLQNVNLLTNIERSVKEMRKRYAAHEKRKTELAGVVEQDHLILSRERAPQLNGLFMRPSISGKRVFGQLEAHKNGFRYQSVKGQKLDLIYNNIAHAFFQPAEQEALVILHFHLHQPIVVGKRKTQDVQFVQETMEASSRLDSRRRAYGDADEIEEEQREKLARKKINRTFFKFCKDVEEFSKKHSDDGDDIIQFDFPSRELGFKGVPFKSNVLLQPTARDCLVHLVEGPPFFVLSLEDVEVASFERVMFGLRQFDLIFILKDYNKNPVSINSIPVEALETLQEWLTKSNVLFYLNPQPFNWTMIMQEVRNKTLKEFMDEGGWSFLGDTPSEEKQAEEESEGESDDFAPEGSESSESDFASEADEEVDGDDDDEEEEEDSEEEAADWDELEKKAARKDREKWGGASEPPIQKKKR